MIRIAGGLVMAVGTLGLAYGVLNLTGAISFNAWTGFADWNKDPVAREGILYTSAGLIGLAVGGVLILAGSR